MDFWRHVRTGRDPRPSGSHSVLSQLDFAKLSDKELDSLGKVITRSGDWDDRGSIEEAGRRQGLRLRLDGPEYTT